MILVGAGFAASALASTIHGTAKADKIHGTAKADTLYGLAGNDTIYGLGGNDKIYGGAGNDHIYGGPGNDSIWGGTGKDVIDCGSGHDVVFADSESTVKGNCEVVHRTGISPSPAPSPPPPPPTTTATTTTTTTTTPAGPQVQEGKYCGFTNNSGGICFDITGTPVVFTNATFETNFDDNDCSPAISGTWDWTTTGDAALSTDGSFDFNIQSGANAGTDVAGKVAADGTAAGTITIRGSFQDNSGNSYNCSLNGTWTATIQR